MKMIYLALMFTAGTAFAFQGLGGSSTGGGSPTEAQKYFGKMIPKNSDPITKDEKQIRIAFYLNGLRGVRKIEKLFYNGGAPKNITQDQLTKARQVFRDIYDQKNGKSFALDPNLKDEDGEPLAANNTSEGKITVNPPEYITKVQMDYHPAVATQIQEIVSTHEVFSQPEIGIEKTKDYRASANLFDIKPEETNWDNTSLTESASQIVQTSKGLWALHFKGLAFSDDDGVSWTEVEELKGLKSDGLSSLVGDIHGDALVGTYKNGIFRVSRTEDGKFKLQSLGLGNHSAEKMALTPDGRIVVAEWGTRSFIAVRDGKDWVEVQNYPGEWKGWRGNVQSLNFLSDGTFIAGIHGAHTGVYTGPLFGEKRLRLDGDSELVAVKVDSADKVWASYRQKYAGRLMVSVDGGQSFTTTINPLNDVIKFIVSNKKGFIVMTARKGVTAYSLDGGKNWKSLSLPDMEVGAVSLTESGYLLISNVYDGVMRSRAPIDQL